MTLTQLNFERLELKFLIDEIIADRHARPGRRAGSSGYTINSLYLDSAALAFHQAKERGDSDRVKLRARTYSKKSDATLEVKRRCSSVIDKRRAVVSRDEVPRAMRGLSGPASPRGKGKAALRERRFCGRGTWATCSSSAMRNDCAQVDVHESQL